MPQPRHTITSRASGGTHLAAPTQSGSIPLAARFVFYFLMGILLSFGNSPKVALAQTDSANGADSNVSMADVPSALQADSSDLPIDSLQLRLLVLEIRKAELQVTQTNLWHRLLPHINASASFGIKDILFIDPSYSVLSVLPKDAYRLTLSLSISEILDFSKHSNAELELEKLQAQYQRTMQQQARSQTALRLQLSELDELLIMMNQEFGMKEDLVKFNELRFKQGRIEYNALVSARLSLLNVKRTIYHLNQQINEIRFKLRNGVQR